MKDDKKTKVQLIDEIVRLRERCATLELTSREYRQLQTEAQDALKYAESIVDAVCEPLIVLDSELRIISANYSFYTTFRVTPKETIGKLIYDLGNRQWDIPKLRILLEEILPEQTEFNGYEVEHEFTAIGRKVIMLNAREIFQESIGSHCILLAMEDITSRKKEEVTLRHESTHDSLTGLYNRAFLDAELERLAHGRMFPISIVMSDVNGLKKVNDTLGHDAGDRLIQLAARIIHEAFRTEDIVVRIGGDEFIVLLPNTAAAIAENIVERMMGCPEISNGQISIAFGIASADNKDQLEEAIKLSDIKMYRDKGTTKSL